MRVPAVSDAGSRPLRGGAGHDADPSVDLLDHDLEHLPAFAFVEPRHLAGYPERRHAVDARRNEEVHHAPEARLVEVAVGLKGRGEDGIDAFELHRTTP